jgi:short-subunit dehydrogenase
MNILHAKGNWALITGASTGIGKEFAIQLAQKGMNVVLVARRNNLLDDLANELQQYGIKVKVIAIDLTIPNAVNLLKQELKKANITVRLLCNNAGIGQWGRFIATPIEEYIQIIHLNNTVMVEMCHQFRDDLASFESSAVINVSSPACYQPVPYMAVYAASKAFVHSVSQALHGEWKEYNILVQTLVPGPTESEFDQKAGAYASALTNRDKPETVVSASLNGLKSGKPVITAAKGTLKQKLFAGLFPASMVIREVGKMFQPPK